MMLQEPQDPDRGSRRHCGQPVTQLDLSVIVKRSYPVLDIQCNTTRLIKPLDSQQRAKHDKPLNTNWPHLLMHTLVLEPH